MNYLGRKIVRYLENYNDTAFCIEYLHHLERKHSVFNRVDKLLEFADQLLHASSTVNYDGESYLLSKFSNIGVLNTQKDEIIQTFLERLTDFLVSAQKLNELEPTIEFLFTVTDYSHYDRPGIHQYTVKPMKLNASNNFVF